MNYFENQMFNPNYVNEAYYRQMQANMYSLDQNERVLKEVHSFKDMIDQIDGMDNEHQQQTVLLCLGEIARKNGWM